MSAPVPSSLLDKVREILAAAAPGLITREDLQRLEERVDELSELVGELEERLSPTACGDTDPPPRP